MADNKVASFGFVPADDTDTQPAATSTTSSGDFGFVPADSGPRKPDPLPTEVAKKIDKDKASLAKNASPIVGIPPGDIYARPNPAAKALYGPFDNAGSASSKLENTRKAIPLNTKIAALQYQQLNEGETPERAQQIKELQAQVPKDQVGGMPRFVIDAASSLGIQLGAGTVGAATGMQAFGQGLLSKMWYVKLIPGASKMLEDQSKKSLVLSDEAVNTAMGSLVGGFYGELRDSGVGVKAAKAASGVMLAAQTALSALAAGKIPGVKQATEALAEASLKAVVSGELAKSVAIQAGKGYLEQGAVAAVNSATQVLLPQFAKSLSNKVDGTDLTWDQANVIWNQFATGTLQQALAMGTVHAIGATIQGTRFAAEASKLSGEIERAREPSPGEAGGVKAASAGGKPGNPESEARSTLPADVAALELAKSRAAQAKLEADAKAAVAAMPADSLDKPIPFEDVPRGTNGDLEAFRTFVKENNPGADKAAIDAASLDTLKANNPNGWAEFSKTHPEPDPIDTQVAADSRVVAAKEQAPALQKAINEEMAKPEPDQARVKALQDTLAADSNRVSHIENQVYQEKFTEQHPKVVAARQALEAAKMDPTQTDKVASLQEALDSARGEANKMAAIRGATRVASERARVDRLEVKHKAIDILKGVDPATFDKASGDTIRQIQEHFAKPPLEAKPGTSKPETQVLDLDALKSALADAKAAHEDIAPEIQDALSNMPSTYSKLTPEQIQGLVAVVKNLQKVKSLEGKIRTGEGWVEQAKVQADAEKSIALPKKSKLGTGATIAKRRGTAIAKVLTNSFSMNGELVFGGKSTLVHKVAVQDVLNAKSDFMREHSRQQEPTRDYLRKTLKIDEQRTPLKWQAYWSKTFTEDGVTLTRNEIMDNYMSFKNENQKASLLEDGTAYASHTTDTGNHATVETIPEATYQKLFAHLEKPELDIIALAEIQLAENGDSLTGYHEDRYGTPITQEENYWPKYVKREGATFDEDIIDIQKANRSLPMSTDESSLISRTGAKGATYTTGFWNKFSESTENSSRILKMGKAVAASSKVFRDPKIADKIANTHGGAVLKQLKEDLAAEAGQRETPHQLDKAMDAMGNLATNAHLGMVSSLKVPWKLAGLSMRSLIANPHGFIPGMIETIARPKKTATAARISSAFVDEAYKHGGTVDLGQLNDSTKAGKVRALGRAIQNKNMALTRAGSNFGFVADATVSRHEAEYQFNRALAGKKMDENFKAITGVSEDQVATLTPEEKMAAVGHYQDSVIGESHAVNDAGYTIGLQKSAAGRIITKFKTEPLKGFEQTRRLAMRFARNPTFGNAGKLFSAVAIYGAAEGALIYGINEGVNALLGVKNKSEQTLGDEEVAANLAYLPLVGDAITEHLYQARHPGASGQSNAVESLAVLPLNTIMDCFISIDPQYTPAQRQAASKRIFKNLKSIFNVPINVGNMEGQ